MYYSNNCNLQYICHLYLREARGLGSLVEDFLYAHATAAVRLWTFRGEYYCEKGYQQKGELIIQHHIDIPTFPNRL